MSIDLNAPGPSSAPPSEFERTPPQNIEAEQGVLGGMLLSKDAISDVLEVLKPTDFYRPAHQTIYEAALDLYARGDPADAVTVMAELNRRGDLARAGGAPYLHTLVSTVVTAASAGYYAKIVAEQAILRRLVEAGTRIVQLGFAGRGQDVDDIVDRAQQAIFDVTERRASEDYIRLEDLLQPTLHEIESIESRDGIMTGVPTGFIELDKLTNGLHPGNLVILAARPAVGKALALDTPLPTPTGWTTMGEVQVGDYLLGSEGQPTRVVAATEVLHLRACFELTFSDGATIVADAQHQWLTTTHTRRRARALVTVGARPEPFTAAAVVTSVEIAATLRVAGAPNHAIGEGDGEVFVTGARRVPSVPVRCVQVDATDHLFLAGPTKIPTHNSTLGLDIARSAAIKHQLPAVIFSLEMSKLEITMRLLSAEARVHLQSMRTGRMSEEDWGRLARRMGEVANAPLFIDDSPNLTMMEIRAKARRLKQRHDLQLVVVDYMQLMTSPKRTENRQQEVSEISRSMKLLAKELDVPVVAISQLNRSPEQRSDKKPQLSDLRESGCVTADTRVWRSDTGAEVTIGELVLTGEKDIPVWTLDENLKIVPGRMTHAFPTGVKEVFELKLASGRTVKASANHPFLTYDGWRRLDELSVGSRLAVPRAVPEPEQPKAWPEAEIVMLAHLIGDGCFASRQPIHYTSGDEANLVAVEQAAAHFGITPRRVPQGSWSHVYLPSPYTPARGKPGPIAGWLRNLGLYGLRSGEKFLPGEVFSLPQKQAALFLRHLWATDGSLTQSNGQVRCYYASSSKRLAEDVQRLLTRFGIVARLKQVGKAGYKPGFHVVVYGSENLLRFLRQIGVHGARGERVEEFIATLADIRANTNVDTVPVEVWTDVRERLAASEHTTRSLQAAMPMQYCGSTFYKHAPSRDRLERVAQLLDDDNLSRLARSDVFWDNVVSIDSLGEQPVFDATVAGTHNFLADGIVVENSLEQDADVVILLYREDAFERESARAGEADFIVAKHRNGPTNTVTVAFQGHYSRFVDMTPT